MTARKATLGLMAALALAVATPSALAQSSERGEKSPDELAIEGIGRLMRALELLIQSIPQYDAPVIDENGDIIIRRRHPTDEPTPERKPAPPPPGGVST
jgi:hypothetical protein